MTRIAVDAIRILLIEDDEDDILLTQRALEKANLWNRLDVVRTGQEALDYLKNEGAYADKEKYARPGLILLDLSLPGVDGREVLEQVHADADLKDIPVVIVSTSDYEKDVEFGRSHGVQNYIIKPVQPDNIIDAIGGTSPSFKVILGNVT
jgi:two-component system response regulator